MENIFLTQNEITDIDVVAFTQNARKYRRGILCAVRRKVDNKCNIIEANADNPSYVFSEWADNVLVFEDDVVPVAKYGEKLAFLAEKQIIECDCFYLSGSILSYERYPDPSNGRQGNILYAAFKNDGNQDAEYRIKMLPLYENNQLRLLKNDFDAVHYLGLSINTISKDGKETFVHDQFGCLFPKKEGTLLDADDLVWFDECEIMDCEDPSSEDYLKLKVNIDGEEQIVQSTNKQFNEWLSLFK